MSGLHPPLAKPPDARWLCGLCVDCSHCGRKTKKNEWSCLEDLCFQCGGGKKAIGCLDGEKASACPLCEDLVLKDDGAHVECSICEASIHEACRVESLEGYKAFGALGMAQSNPAKGEFTCLKCCWKLKREKSDKDLKEEAGKKIEEQASALKERQRQALVERTEAAQRELESVRRAKRERWEREELNREKYLKIIEDASKLLQVVDFETSGATKIAAAVLKRERAKRASVRAEVGGKVQSDPRKAFLKKLEGVCLALMKMNDSYFFRVPVDRKLYPKYYTFIEKPIDLSTIRSKVKGGEYQDTAQVREGGRARSSEEIFVTSSLLRIAAAISNLTRNIIPRIFYGLSSLLAVCRRPRVDAVKLEQIQRPDKPDHRAGSESFEPGEGADRVR